MVALLTAGIAFGGLQMQVLGHSTDIEHLDVAKAEREVVAEQLEAIREDLREIKEILRN